MTREQEVNQLIAEAQSKLQQAIKVCMKITSTVEEKEFKEDYHFDEFQERCVSKKKFLEAMLEVLDHSPRI